MFMKLPSQVSWSGCGWASTSRMARRPAARPRRDLGLWRTPWVSGNRNGCIGNAAQKTAFGMIKYDVYHII
jgi:hypothetical protein